MKKKFLPVFSYIPIRINIIKVEFTVAALKQGKDEVLQRGIEFIESGQ